MLLNQLAKRLIFLYHLIILSFLLASVNLQFGVNVLYVNLNR